MITKRPYFWLVPFLAISITSPVHSQNLDMGETRTEALSCNQSAKALWQKSVI